MDCEVAQPKTSHSKNSFVTPFEEVLFYFDIIKMDGRFTKDLTQSADNQASIYAVIGIARSFEMFCVAQNVETASDAEVLTTLGVDCLQGYHLGVPTLTSPWQQ